MRVLMAHNDYKKFSGEEQAVETVAELLGEKGHSVSWLRKTSEGVQQSFRRKIDAFISAFYSRSARGEIEGILEFNNIDLVHVQNLYPFLSPSILIPCRERGIPVVMRCPNYRLFCPNGLHYTKGEVCERCLDGREWQCILKNCLESYPKSIGYALRNAFARLTGMILNNVTVFIVLSEFQKKRFIEGGIAPERIEILPNPAPTDKYTNQNDGADQFVAYVGRVSAEKGIDAFLDAARNLKQRPFRVAGSTIYMPFINNAAPANVSFEGFLSGRDLDDFYSQSRFIVFPSVWFEGFPNVVAKAMVHGKAVIASRIGPLPEIVEDGVTGLLFEPGNAADLVEKIDYLWDNPKKATEMGKAGRKKAKALYSEDIVYHKLMEIYEKAIRTNAHQISAQNKYR